jgi:hypothetical protein
MASGDAPQPLPEVVAFYARGLEDQRLSRDAGLHRPQELAGEMTDAGFGQTSVLAIEGPGWLMQDFEAQ